MKAAGPVATIKEPLAMLDKAKQMEDGSVVDYNSSALEAARLKIALAARRNEPARRDRAARPRARPRLH